MNQNQNITVEKSLLEQCLRMMNERTKFTLRGGIDSYSLASQLERVLKKGGKPTNHQKEKWVLEDIVGFLMKVGYTVRGAWDSHVKALDTEIQQINSGSLLIRHLVHYAVASEVGSITFGAPNGKAFSLHILCGNLPLEVISDMTADDDDTLTAGVAIVEARTRYLEQEAQWL